MSRYPDSVDVAIVGSGPTGAAYARILSEEAPGVAIAMFEVGPTVSDPPGAHVRNIEDAAARAAAQRASEGPGAGADTVNSPGAVRTAASRLAVPASTAIAHPRESLIIGKSRLRRPCFIGHGGSGLRCRRQNA